MCDEPVLCSPFLWGCQFIGRRVLGCVALVSPVVLSFQCAGTFRSTDYLGGCNGARIRFPPEANWSVNIAMDDALTLLQGVKDQFPTGLSWADLIVLAGKEVHDS